MLVEMRIKTELYYFKHVRLCTINNRLLVQMYVCDFASWHINGCSFSLANLLLVLLRWQVR
jgi:hypothetical protein